MLFESSRFFFTIDVSYTCSRPWHLLQGLYVSYSHSTIKLVLITSSKTLSAHLFDYDFFRRPQNPIVIVENADGEKKETALKDIDDPHTDTVGKNIALLHRNSLQIM